jgi:hypothetical protein
MRVRIVEAFELVLVAMVVAACNGGDQPSTLPDATSATATVPTTESAAHTPTGDPTAQLEAEITEFYKLYVETINESWTSEEALDKRKSMFAESCLDCRRGYELAQRARTEGLILNDGTISMTDVTINTSADEHVVFTSITNSSAGTLKDRAGNLVQKLAGTSDVQITYQAERNDSGEWVLTSSEALS